MPAGLRRLQTFADRLFGAEESGPRPPEAWLGRYLAVAALFALVIVARRPDFVTKPQFWGEDGYIFFSENLLLGFPAALAKMYRDFPYLTHRLIAFAGGLVPFAEAPRVYTTSAIAITALGLAIFAMPLFRHLVHGQALRVLFGVAVLSAPFDQEVLGTVTNLGWFLAVILTLLSLVRLPRAPWRVGVLALGGGLLVASTPLAVINLPLWLLRAWRAARRAMWREVVFALVLVVALAAISVLTRGMGAQVSKALSRPRTIAEVGVAAAVRLVAVHPLWLTQSAFGAAAYETAALVLPPTAMAWLVAAGSPAVVVLAILVLAALLALCARGRYRTFPTLLTAGTVFVAYFFVLFAGRVWVRGLFGGPGWARVPDRYTIFPTAMFALAVVAVLDGLAAGRARRLIGTAVAALLIGAWSSRFAVGPLRDVNWPRAAAQLERKLATQSRAPLTLANNPAWTPIRFDALRMTPAGPLPAKTALARLGAEGAVRLQFTSSCELLGGIELRLGSAAASMRGALRMTLLDDSGTVVSEQEMPRAELPLDGSWHGLYFEPVVGSRGKRYTVALHAIQNDPGASITILGSRSGTRPAGGAVVSGQGLDGEVSFRHGCAEASP